MLALASQREALAALRAQMRPPAGTEQAVCFHGLDGVLPAGIRRGALVECLTDGGGGAVALALVIAREACREGQSLVVVDRRRRFYPPAAVPFGVNSDAILVRTQSHKDELWALNQSLRCPGVGAVMAWPNQLDGRAFRALQLAAESSGAVGLFVRPLDVRGHPSWSEVQLLIEPLPGRQKRRMRLEVVRCRTGNPGASIIVELDDATGTLRLATELAAATGATRPARA
jgi:protein ImuA